jgi:1-deoxy-D-xylulose-5-phosphate reductoisomerase
MKGPIAYALSYPNRLKDVMERLDLKKLESLHFYEPDTKSFPCLALAFAAVEGPESMPSALNAANEIAVAAFLEEKIAFLDIPRIIEYVLETMNHTPLSDLEHVVQVDQEARRLASEFVEANRSSK